jgi:hypothetical protein
MPRIVCRSLGQASNSIPADASPAIIKQSMIEKHSGLQLPQELAKLSKGKGEIC